MSFEYINKVKKILRESKMQTKVFDGKYDGTKAIWKIDEDGEKVGEYPIISIGKKKLKAIMDHAEELKEFVESE